MKKIIFILVFILVFLTGCNNNETELTTGIPENGEQIITAIHDEENSGESKEVPEQHEELQNSSANGEILFQLVGSYNVDTAGIRISFNIAEGAPVTFFDQIRNLQHYVENYAYEAHELDLSGVNFEDYYNPNKYYVITIGRELVEMRYELIDGPWEPDEMEWVRAEVIFAEDYNSNRLYLYVMDQIRFYNPILGGDMYFAFYTMQGSEKLYEGNSISHINTQNEEFKRELREQYQRGR